MSRGGPKKRVDQVQTTISLEREIMLQLKQYCRQEADRLGRQFSLSDGVAEAIVYMLMIDS